MPYVTTDLDEPEMPNQRGQTCGLYALEGVIQNLEPFSGVFATSDKHSEDPPSRNAGGDRFSLRNIAKQLKISVIGEVFKATNMVRLVDEVRKKHSVSIQAKAVKGTNWAKTIRWSIDKGYYVLAPFGVDDEGHPQLHGSNAHWCVVYGYSRWDGPQPRGNYTLPNEDVRSIVHDGPPPPMFAHVKHWGKSRWFNVDEFRESSKKLKRWKKTKYGKLLRWKEIGNVVPNDNPALYTGINYQSMRDIKEWSLSDCLAKNKKGKDKIVTIPAADLPKDLADWLVIVAKTVVQN